MTPKLTDEQRKALDLHGGRLAAVEDDQTHDRYLLVAEGEFQRLLGARLIQEIDAGMKQAEHGEVIEVRSQAEHDALFTYLKRGDHAGRA